MRCENCGYQLNKEDLICPECGTVVMVAEKKPLPTKKIAMIASAAMLLVVAFVVGIIIATGGSDNTNIQVKPSQASNQNSDIVNKAADTSFVGERLVKADKRYIYTDLKKIYTKSTPEDKGVVLTECSNNGQIMVGENKIYVTRSENPDARVNSYFNPGPNDIYSMNEDGTGLKKITSSDNPLRFLCIRNGKIYYLELVKDADDKMIEYNIADNKKTDITDKMLVNNEHEVLDVVYDGDKLYARTGDSDGGSTYDLIAYDLDKSKTDAIIEDSYVSFNRRHPDAGVSFTVYKLKKNEYKAYDIYVYTLNADGTFDKSVEMPEFLDQAPECVSYDGLYAIFMTSSGCEDFNLYRVDLKTGDTLIYEKGAGRFKNKGYGVCFDLTRPDDIYLFSGSAMRVTENGMVECNCDKDIYYQRYWMIDGMILDESFNCYEIVEGEVLFSPVIKKAEKDTEKPTEAPTKESPKQTSYDQYKGVIDAYIDAYPWNNGSKVGNPVFIDGFDNTCNLYSYLHNLSDAGYTFADIDGNGQEELLICSNLGGKTHIYDMFTIVNGKIIHLFAAAERLTYRLCSDNTIFSRGSSGAVMSHMYILTLDPKKGEMKCIESLKTDGYYAQEIGLVDDPFDIDGDTGSFYAEDGVTYKNIPGEEYLRIEEEYENKVVNIDYTPFE